MAHNQFKIADKLAPLLRGLSSLKLTVALLTALLILVFVCTLDQVNMGIFYAKKKYFETLFVNWHPTPKIRIPVFPGGVLIGTLLTLNLLVAHFTRFKWTLKKSGIWLTHIGLLILIIGSGLSSALSEESQLPLNEGQSRNYSINYEESELAVIVQPSETQQIVTAIPASMLHKGRKITHESLPFSIEVTDFFPNAELQILPDRNPLSPVNRGAGPRLNVMPLPLFTRDNLRNFTTAYLELFQNGQSLGVWLVSSGLETPQPVFLNGAYYWLIMRPKRTYTPYSLTLLAFSQERYTGTDTPKSYASRVRINDPKSHETRETVISMNNPLRYKGSTYYQASFANEGKTSVLQVVQNPSWPIPYIACTMIAVGLLLHFAILLSQSLKRRPTP